MSKYAICHGHVHRPEYKGYTTVDSYKVTQPDIHGNVTSIRTQAKLGHNIAVLRFIYCPVNVYVHKNFPKLLQRVRIGGKAVMPFSKNPNAYYDLSGLSRSSIVDRDYFASFTTSSFALIRSHVLLNVLRRLWKKLYGLVFSVHYSKRTRWVTLVRKK